MNMSVNPAHPLELICEELDIWLYLALLPGRFLSRMVKAHQMPHGFIEKSVCLEKTQIVFMTCDLRRMNERISQTTKLGKTLERNIDI